MRNRAYLLLLVFMLGSGQSQAQSKEGQGFRLNDVVVTFLSYAEGRATADGFVPVYSIEPNKINRILINDSTGVYIGYTLQVEPLPGSTKLNIALKPLPEEAIRRMKESVWMKKFESKWPNKSSYDPAPLPRYPEPQVIDVTDVVKLPLWINAETRSLIGDQIRFALDRPRPARDFTLDDVMLKLSGFRLIINGEVRSGDREFGGLFSGPLPWFYVPGKGRFILSIKPYDGYDFQKIGVIDDKKITFSYGGDEYEWTNRSRVLDYGGKWHLWVLHDDSFQPSREALDDLNLISKGNCCLYGALGAASLLPSPKK